MVQALHKNGIRVVMDVVYNHTYSEDSWLQRMVPGYYYRHREDGSLSDGSACGNDIAAGRAMVDNYIVDSVMYVGLVLCMGYQLTGNLWHEYIGIFMFILFIIHLILNDHWFKHFGKIAKNSFSNIRSALLFLTDILLFFDVIALAITSALISKNVFSFVGLQGSRFTSWLHTFSAYLGLIIISLHIGCHWKGILLRMCNLFEMNKGTKGIKVVSRIIAGLLAVLGVVFSFQRDIGRRLLWDSSMKTMRPDMVKPDFSSADKNEFRNVQPNRDMQYGKGKEKNSKFPKQFKKEKVRKITLED